MVRRDGANGRRETIYALCSVLCCAEVAHWLQLFEPRISYTYSSSLQRKFLNKVVWMT